MNDVRRMTVFACGAVEAIGAGFAAANPLLAMSPVPAILAGSGLNKMCYAYSISEEEITLEDVYDESIKGAITATTLDMVNGLGLKVIGAGAAWSAKAVVSAFSNTTANLAAAFVGKEKDPENFQKQIEPKNMAINFVVGGTIGAALTHTKAVVEWLGSKLLGRGVEKAQNKIFQVGGQAVNGAMAGAAGGFVCRGVMNCISIINDNGLIICDKAPEYKKVHAHNLYLYLQDEKVCFKVKNDKNKVVEMVIEDDELGEHLASIKKVLECKGTPFTAVEKTSIFKATASKGYPPVSLTTGLGEAMRQGVVNGFVQGVSNAARQNVESNRREQQATQRGSLPIRNGEMRIFKDGKLVDPNSAEWRALYEEMPKQDPSGTKWVLVRRTIVPVPVEEAQVPAPAVVAVVAPQVDPAEYQRVTTERNQAAVSLNKAIAFDSFTDLNQKAKDIIGEGQLAVGRELDPKDVARNDTGLVYAIEKFMFDAYGIPMGAYGGMLLKSTAGNRSDRYDELVEKMVYALVDHKFNLNPRIINDTTNVINRCDAFLNAPPGDAAPPPAPPAPVPYALNKDTIKTLVEKSKSYSSNYFARAAYISWNICGSQSGFCYESLYKWLSHSYDPNWIVDYGPLLERLLNTFVNGQTQQNTSQSSVISHVNAYTNTPIIPSVNIRYDNMGLIVGGGPQPNMNLWETPVYGPPAIRPPVLNLPTRNGPEVNVVRSSPSVVDTFSPSREPGSSVAAAFLGGLESSVPSYMPSTSNSIPNAPSTQPASWQLWNNPPVDASGMVRNSMNGMPFEATLQIHAPSNQGSSRTEVPVSTILSEYFQMATHDIEPGKVIAGYCNRMVNGISGVYDYLVAFGEERSNFPEAPKSESVVCAAAKVTAEQSVEEAGAWAGFRAGSLFGYVGSFIGAVGGAFFVQEEAKEAGKAAQEACHKAFEANK